MKALITKPTERQDIKNVYLFCCFTGLLISDVLELRTAFIAIEGNIG